MSFEPWLDQAVDQACAVAFRESTQGSIEFCLITTSSGRWTFPKGLIEPSWSVAETAIQEAWEEAGLRGIVHSNPLGCYRLHKAGRQMAVVALLFQVLQAEPIWKEASKRRRKWVLPQQAACLLARDDQIEMIRRATSEIQLILGQPRWRLA